MKGNCDKMKLCKISLLLFILLLLLAGCSSGDNDVSTPEPEARPTPFPVVEPQPECSHFWIDPDCFNPYTCLDCGETRGSPLEHVWTTANFQEASTCVNCGETSGGPTEPNLVRYGFRINTTAGRPFNYTTITSTDPELTTVGIARLLHIDIFESDVDYPYKPGYEYIVARFMITFDDENARTHGFTYLIGQLDFFGFDPDEIVIPHNELRDSDIPDFKIANRMLNYFGNEYEYFIKYTLIQKMQVGNIWYLEFEYAFLVPAGYDGMVVYISSSANWSDADNRTISDNFDDDTLFFRLRTQTN